MCFYDLLIQESSTIMDDSVNVSTYNYDGSKFPLVFDDQRESW